MKKLLRGMLLLSVFIFVINCQTQATKSDFQEVNEELSQEGNGISKPPTEDDSSDKLKPLTYTEFDIADKPQFNQTIDPSNPRILNLPIRFNISQDAQTKITEADIWNDTKTEKGATLTLVKYNNANHDILKTAIQLKNIKYTGPNLDATTYHVVYSQDLINALTSLDSYAVYRVDFAIKDKNDPKKYALTKRSFEFTINRR